VAGLKARIRAVCAALDERVLIPEKSPRLELRREGEAVTVALGARSYRFPRAEVALLPLPNVTIEALAQHVWAELAPSLAGGRVRRLRVEVEETAGQSAAYEADLS
jgi:6-pyruvoyltetrahydropterin/6-carboxytetrahydropterin synthase